MEDIRGGWIKWKEIAKVEAWKLAEIVEYGFATKVKEEKEEEEAEQKEV